ncbi:MAG: homoserine dehydrogenase [Anaerovoracaceae bacterium]|jgi:homoserine dehydrogenase
MAKKFKLAILGLGTVGGGAYDILIENRDLIQKRIGAEYEISHVLEINEKAIEAHHVPKDIVTTDADTILTDSDTDIVIEALGGIHPATEFMLTALRNGKSVVTPNKAAIAANYQELMQTAKEHDVDLRIEATVGGGIPILTTIQDALIANHFTEIIGIVNGTTNFILTKMAETGISYEEALQQAKDNGFAEQDPTADVEGIDSANKLTILMALAFDRYIPPQDIPREGVTNITKADLVLAKDQNCRLKLVAHAKLDENGELHYSVKPEEIPLSSPLARVDNEMNAILVYGDAIGETMLYGPGAGRLPTGSAIVGDAAEIMCRLKSGR